MKLTLIAMGFFLLFLSELMGAERPCQGAPGRKHRNGGGFVALTAYVEPTAYIGPDAQVCDQARVTGWPQIYDRAKVYGQARVFGLCFIYGSAEVYDQAWVFGLNTAVFGNYHVNGKRRLYSGQWFEMPKSP